MSWTALCFVTSTKFCVFPVINEVEIPLISNIERVTLYDGSIAFQTPPTKSRKEPFTLELSPQLSAYSPNQATVISKLQEAIEGNYKIKLKSNTNEEWNGYFRELRKKFRFSGKTQDYYLTLTFIPDS